MSMKISPIAVAKAMLDAWASDIQFTQINYNYLRLRYGKGLRFLNLRNPHRFSEKVAWLKLFHRQDQAHILADKYAVRDYVADRVGSDILIPLYDAFDGPDQIDIAAYPNRFVIKPNHASGEVEFCDKRTLDVSALKVKMKAWLELDYGKLGREYQYSMIPRKIVVEQDLSELAGTVDIVDYKFFCFNGVPEFVQVDLDRFAKHTRNFYDLSWCRQSFKILHDSREEDALPPINLSQMTEISRSLSDGLAFARVDLYEVGGKIYFGEITLHPGGGIEPIWPEEYDEILGSRLDISKPFMLFKNRLGA